MIQLIAIGAGALVAGVLGIAATRPDRFSVQRSTTIAAPPEKIHPWIDDFRRWGEWSPWEKMDPGMARTFSGAERGPGAAYAWEGKKVGAGRMEIRESTPRRVAIQLDFLKPWEAHNTAEFTLDPQGAGTRVTWAMHGASPFISKVMGMFIDMDRMIGKDFETGLANLKAAAER